MEKKQNDMNLVEEISLDQMNKVSGGTGNETADKSEDESQSNPSPAYIPPKRNPRL